MIDLLKQQKNNKGMGKENIPQGLLSMKKDKPTQQVDSEVKQISEQTTRGDIGSYKDSLGLSGRKMSIGLWFVENRKNFLRVSYAVLILISVVTWSMFFYVFGGYIISGMAKDEEMARGIVDSTLVRRQIVVDDLEPLTTQVVKNNDKYDFVATIKNSNINYWAEFDYYFLVGQNEVGRSRGFILPNETKYLISLAQDLNQPSLSAKLVIDNISWMRVNPHQFVDWTEFKNSHLDIKIDDIEFTSSESSVLTEKIKLSNLSFVAINNTGYNYWSVDFIVLLLNRSKIIGVDKRVSTEFMSGESRNVSTTMTGDFGLMSSVLIIPDINITKDDIYIKFKGK